MSAGDSNPRGHFEDMDFHEFHVAVLTSQGFGAEGFIREPVIHVQEQFLEDARALIESRRRAGRSWGWKEPRSTLFLDFWGSLVPELRFLLLFRRPWDVIDSLYSRGDSIFHKNPKLAVQIWINYNRAILDFSERFPHRCLLIESHAAALQPKQLTEALIAKFGDHFGPISAIYEDELFRHDDSNHRRSVLAHFHPEAVTIYDRLRSRGALVLDSKEPLTDRAVEDWALQHWIDFRRLDSRYCSVPGRSEPKREDLRARLSPAEKELDGARVEVQQLRTTVKMIEAERDDSRNRLVQIEQDLERLRRAFQQSQAHLSWVQTSKFWKLRRLWLRVRSPFDRSNPITDGLPLVASSNGDLNNARHSEGHARLGS
jgi:hypothetical protein